LIEATLTQTDQYGRATISAEGVTVTSTQYPLNRLCRALMMIGLDGPIEVYGPDGDLRLTAIIEENGRRRLSETETGFHWAAWTERSLEPLRKAVAKVSLTPASGREAA